LRKNLARDLTNIARRNESIYTEERLAGMELSRASRRFINNPPDTPKEFYLMNRALLHDAFPDYISQKINYRVAYVLVIVLATIACMLTLTARRGKYADTLRDVDYVEI